VRLCLLGPLLYVGLTMIVDPARFLRWVADLSLGLHNFERSLLGMRRLPIWKESGSPRSSPKASNSIRVAGLLLSVYAFLYLAWA
jgi:hypothetical protein